MWSLSEVGELVFEEAGLPGAAVAMAAVVLAPLAGRALRPVAKELIKGGYVIARKGREVAHETGERWSDLIAEARSELEAEPSADREENAPTPVPAS